MSLCIPLCLLSRAFLHFYILFLINSRRGKNTTSNIIYVEQILREAFARPILFEYEKIILLNNLLKNICKAFVCFMFVK